MDEAAKKFLFNRAYYDEFVRIRGMIWIYGLDRTAWHVAVNLRKGLYTDAGGRECARRFLNRHDPALLEQLGMRLNPTLDEPEEEP